MPQLSLLLLSRAVAGMVAVPFWSKITVKFLQFATGAVLSSVIVTGTRGGITQEGPEKVMVTYPLPVWNPAWLLGFAPAL